MTASAPDSSTVFHSVRSSVSIVIPTLNEARNLPAVVEALPPIDAQIVVVDGGSLDDTVAVATRLLPNALILTQTRRGKGNALACGFAQCTGDVIVMLDADGSTDPAEIPAYLRALEQGADFAKGSRFCAGGRSDDITRVRRIGNWVLNTLVNLLFRSRFSDLCYGFNAFRRDLLPVMDLPSPDLEVVEGGRVWGDGFEIETLMNVRVARSRCSVVEVPSIERPRMYGESNLSAVRDGLRVLRTIAIERTRRAVLYQPGRVLDLRDETPTVGQRLKRRARALEPAAELDLTADVVS